MTVTMFLAKVAVGALLAWVALPILKLAARAVKNPMPDARERTLLYTLGCAFALFFVPFVSPGAVTLTVAKVSSPLVGADGPSRKVPEPAWPPLAAVGAVFLIAAAVRLSVRGSAWLSLQRKLDQAAPLPERVARIREKLCRELGIAPPEVVVSEVATLPFVTGVLKPRVFIPSAILSRLGDDQLESVLRHELIHVSRNDGRTALLAELLLAPFPGHPTARHLFSELVLAREEAVDLRASAVDPHAYATLLVDVAAYHRHGQSLAGSVAMGQTALGQRIDLLTRPLPVDRDVLARLFMVIVALLLGAAALLVPRIAPNVPVIAYTDAATIPFAVGEMKEMDLGPVRRIAIGDPAIADVKLLDNFQLLIRGVSPGKTTLIVWRNDGRRVSYLLSVK